MANQVRVGVGVTGAAKASSDVDKLRDRFAKLQAQGAKGLAIGAGIAAVQGAAGLADRALAAVIDQTFAAIDAASKLNETESKSRVVFGSAADAMDKWADHAATAFGQSKQAALEASATFGNLFESMGMGRQQAAQMSEQLVQLAGDLASFNNIDPTEAMAKLQSGIVGETKAVRDLGIDISETTVTQELMREGVKKVGGEYTNAQKIVARYNLILAQTKNAQGDFARTSDQLANSQRILNAEIENRKAQLGKDLMPLELEWDKLLIRLLGDTTNLNEALHKQFDYNEALGINLLKSRTALSDVVIAQVEAALATGKTADSEHMLGIAIRDGNAAMAAQVGAADEATSATADLRDEYQKTTDAAKGVDQALADLDKRLYGGAIAAGDVAQAQQDLADVLKAEPQKHSGNEWKIWSGKVAEARQRLFDLQYQEKQIEGPKALYDWLLKQQGSLSKADLKAQAYMNTLRALALLSSTMPPVNFVQNYIDRLPSGKTGTTTQRFAEGGIVKAKPGGTLALIGEAGQDEAVVPIGRGPTAGKLVAPSGGSAGSTVVNINISGVSVLTPGSAEALARQLEPVITRAQQQRGHLARAGAF